MKRWFPILAITLLYSLFGCKEKKTIKPQISTPKAIATIKYTPPSIPYHLRNTSQAIDYLAEHYWDSIDFTDTLYLHNNDIMEQTWCNYCDLLNRVSPMVATKSIRKVIKSADASRAMFKYLTTLAEKYLYNPNSPIRNEEYYIPVLHEMLASSSLNKTEKIRPETQLKLAIKNRVGEKGNNFCYTLVNGEKGYLYKTKTDYLLVFFNSPDCNACRKTINLLKEAPAINKMFNTGKLKILSLYPDEEVDYWRQHINEFPSHWICAYDKEMIIREKQIYDLKALPTIYLFDKNKTVLLKDVTPQQVEYFLSLQE